MKNLLMGNTTPIWKRIFYNHLLYKLLYLMCRFSNVALPLPIFGIYLYLTNKCNMKCSYCFAKDISVQDQHEISYADIVTLEKNLRFAFWKPRIHFFGGEPTLIKDFLPIAKYLSDRGYPLTLRTNGRIDPVYFKEILALHAFDRILISVHSADFEHIKMMTRLIDESNVCRKRKVRYYLCFTFAFLLASGITLDYIMQYFESTQARHIRILHMRDLANKDLLDIDKINRFIEQVKLVRVRRYRIPLFFSPKLKIEEVVKFYRNDFKKNETLCYFLWFLVAVLPNGEVEACQKYGKLPFNLFKQRLVEIWNSKVYQQLRKDLRQNKVVSLQCQRCLFRCYYGRRLELF